MDKRGEFFTPLEQIIVNGNPLVDELAKEKWKPFSQLNAELHQAYGRWCAEGLEDTKLFTEFKLDKKGGSSDETPMS